MAGSTPPRRCDRLVPTWARRDEDSNAPPARHARLGRAHLAQLPLLRVPYARSTERCEMRISAAMHPGVAQMRLRLWYDAHALRNK